MKKLLRYVGRIDEVSFGVQYNMEKKCCTIGGNGALKEELVQIALEYFKTDEHIEPKYYRTRNMIRYCFPCLYTRFLEMIRDRKLIETSNLRGLLR
jgi:hypothetical protein